MEDIIQTQSRLETTEESVPKKKERIQIIDAARGLAVTLMVVHHAVYLLVEFFGMPTVFFNGTVVSVLRMFFIGVFMIVSGISSRFSRDNVSRGAIVLILGVLVTYVTVRVVDMPIWFGILSVLGTLMIFYGVTRNFWDKIPLRPAIWLYIALIIITTWARYAFSPTTNIPAINDILFVLGWRQPGYFTYDYETILPWIFVFLLGTRIGAEIKNGFFPKWFYEARFPFFPVVGRNALVIYCFHQPILYGLAMLVLQIKG